MFYLIIKNIGEVCPAGWKDGDNAMAESQESVSNYLSENAESL